MSNISTVGLLKQQDFPDSFKFYFKLQKNKNSVEEISVLKVRGPVALAVWIRTLFRYSRYPAGAADESSSMSLSAETSGAGDPSAEVQVFVSGLA